MVDFIQEMRSLIQLEDYETARVQLTKYLHKSPANARAWVLLSYCMETDQEKRYCLENALSVSPDYEPARAELAKLGPVWIQKIGFGAGAFVFGVVVPVLVGFALLVVSNREAGAAEQIAVMTDIPIISEEPEALPELEVRTFDAGKDSSLLPVPTTETLETTPVVEEPDHIALPDIPSAFCIPEEAERIQAEVVAITEPGILMVALGDEIVQVRYLGISMDNLNNQAAAHALITNQTLQGQMVTLVAGVADIDADGTLPRYVFLGEFFINFQMLEWGLAKATDEGLAESCSGFFLAAQLSAMDQQLGHWKPIDVRMDPAEWQSWPMIPRISENAKQIYLQGVENGNNPQAFSIYGDCQSLSWRLFQRLDWDGYVLPPELVYMQPTRDYFRGSYGRNPVTTIDGATVASMFSVYWADPAVCEAGELPIECEMRVHNPSITLITLGTNWVGEPEQYDTYLRQLIEVSIAHGVLPILVTKVDGGPDYPLNRIMAQVAYDYDIPLWNFWLAVQELPNNGMDAEDVKGIHFLDDAFPVKRITGLMTLHAVREAVSH